MCACSPPSPSTATVRRSSRRLPSRTARNANFATVHVPELPPRVVALTSHRRPGPSGAVKALFDVLRAALPARALEQAGVRLGSDAFPLLRSTRCTLAELRSVADGCRHALVAQQGRRRGNDGDPHASTAPTGRVSVVWVESATGPAPRPTRHAVVVAERRRTSPTPPPWPATKESRSSSCSPRPAPTSSRGSPPLEGWGRVAKALVDCSGVVPTVLVVDGPAVVRAGAPARYRRPRRDDGRRAMPSSTGR